MRMPRRCELRASPYRLVVWDVISKRKRRMQTTISSERAIHLMSLRGRHSVPRV